MKHFRHSEAAFETVIESHLLANGYVSVSSGSFDRARAIFPEVVLSFLREIQPREWVKIEALRGLGVSQKQMAFESYLMAI